MASISEALKPRLVVVAPRTPMHLRKPQGLRIAEPYEDQHRAFCKERWIGRNIVELLCTEFRERSPNYYKWAIDQGLVSINGKPVDSTYRMKPVDQLQNHFHRHEPAVTDRPIKIIYHDPTIDLLVVDKPGSIPVHRTGRYAKHTLLSILTDEMGYSTPYTSNRLDRLTSGIMLVGLTPAMAKELGSYFQEGVVKKEYLARVIGKFPDGKIICDQPLITIDRQSSLVIVHPDGKDSETHFERMSYDQEKNESLVYCRPITGRTHQIRVHLQYLGHPIPNDPMYAPLEIWGENRGKNGIELNYEEDNRNIIGGYQPSGKPAEDIHDNSDIGANSPVPICTNIVTIIRNLRLYRDEQEDWARWRDEMPIADRATAGEITPSPSDDIRKTGGKFCPDCWIPLIEPCAPEKLFIYLHAVRYTTPQWQFESELPDWVGTEGEKWWATHNGREWSEDS